MTFNQLLYLDQYVFILTFILNSVPVTFSQEININLTAIDICIFLFPSFAFDRKLYLFEFVKIEFSIGFPTRSKT